MILRNPKDSIPWPWPKSLACFCECWCNHNSKRFPGCWGYSLCVCVCVKSRIWRADYNRFVTCFSVWRVSTVRNTEGLLWLNFLLSQTEWELQEAKKYTQNPWLKRKSLKILYASFLSWPAMRHQNRLGFFSCIFKICSLIVHLVSDVLQWKTTTENLGHNILLKRKFWENSE